MRITRDDIPATTSMIPRPVLARLLLRYKGEMLFPPTDAEKHDAILVLRDWCAMKPDEWDEGLRLAGIVCESQRIMDECSL